jgi:hypothetical protein
VKARELKHVLQYVEDDSDVLVYGGEHGTIMEVRQICTDYRELDWMQSRKGAVVLMPGVEGTPPIAVPPLPALPAAPQRGVLTTIVRLLLTGGKE